VGGWNPFEDKVQFGAITEDALFGEEFDRLRNGSGGSLNNISSQVVAATVQQQQPRRDPFGSAPFTGSQPDKQF